MSASFSKSISCQIFQAVTESTTQMSSSDRLKSKIQPCLFIRACCCALPKKRFLTLDLSHKLDTNTQLLYCRAPLLNKELSSQIWSSPGWNETLTPSQVLMLLSGSILPLHKRGLFST